MRVPGLDIWQRWSQPKRKSFAPTDVPRVVVNYVARQLGIADLAVLKGYGGSETRWDHAAEVRRASCRRVRARRRPSMTTLVLAAVGQHGGAAARGEGGIEPPTF